MRDYKGLVKKLRDCRNMAVYSKFWWDITTEAADAIEELITQRRGNEEAVKVMQMEIDRLLASRTPKEEADE